MIWGSNYQSNLQPIITAQKRAIRLVAGTERLSHTSPLFRELKLLKLPDLLKYNLILVLHASLYGFLPPCIGNKFVRADRPRATRQCLHYSENVQSVSGVAVPNYRHFNYRLFSLFCQAPRIWNNTIASRVPNMQDIPPSKSLFKKCVRLLFLEEY